MKFLDLFEKINKRILIIITILSALVTILGFSFDKDIITILSAIVVSVIISLYGIYGFLKRAYKRKNALNQSNLGKQTKKHSKKLLKFEKILRRRLNKHKRIKHYKQEILEIKKINKLISKESNINNKEVSLTKNEIVEYRELLKLMKFTNSDQTFILTNIFNQSIISLESTLLQTELYKTRIKLGKFLSNYSFNYLNIQKAYIDLIGWTKLMQGDFIKGSQSILEGIKVAKFSIDETKDINVKKESLMNVCRGYRHLGSYKYILENNFNKAIEYNEIGLKELYKLNKDDYSNEKYEGMEIGLNYGIVAANYFKFKNKLNNFKATKDDFNKFFNNVKLIDKYSETAKKFSNNHRLIKLKLIKIKYLELIYDYKDRFINHVTNDFNINEVKSSFEHTLEETKKLFQVNIFNDDSLEVYLNSKIKELTYNLTDVLRKENNYENSSIDGRV